VTARKKKPIKASKSKAAIRPDEGPPPAPDSGRQSPNKPKAIRPDLAGPKDAALSGSSAKIKRAIRPD
jgi:hypothetical protein